MDDEGYESEIRYGRTQFDYKQILLIHLRNMSNLITQKIFPNTQQPYTPTEMFQIVDESIGNSFEWGVDFLNSLLAPYCKKDKKYLEELKKLNDESKNMLVKTYNKRKFSLLIEAMDRLNLLLEGEIGEEI